MSQTSIFFQGAKDLYFADESDVMTVGSTDMTTPVEVVVKADSEPIASFTLDTYNGLAIIPIGEILRSSVRRNRSEGSQVKVTLTQGGVSASHTARCLFCRRFGAEADALFTSWLTCGPAERVTYMGAAEILAFLSDPDSISHRAMVQIRFAGGMIQTRVFADLKDKSGDGLDVSPAALRDFARSLMVYSEIEGYSLWIERVNASGESATGTAVSFTVSRDRLERITYKFVNPRGAYEYIHASGDLRRSIESDTGTFVTSGVETEISNDATKTMEQNSGHIGGSAEAEFWLGFLSSKERYVREADGTERLIVVDESKPSVTDLKVGELTFRWHYSNKNNTIINKISIPVESIEITGDSVVDTDENQLQLGITYNPAATTQRGVVWQLVSGGEFASLSATGLLIVKEGAQGASVTVKAVSSHNGDVQATKELTVTYHAEPAPAYGLTITSNVDSPAITLKIDGASTQYFDGILISEGQEVAITVAKSGYSTESRTFTFSYGAKDQHFDLEELIYATISFPREISSGTQNVPIVVSDPQGHGWYIDTSDAQYHGYVTGAGVTSGNASASAYGISGTGDAVVYITVSGAEYRTIDFYFWDTSYRSQTQQSCSIYQSGESRTPVTSVTLNKSSLSMTAGSSQTLTATVTPSGATDKSLTWSSTNTSVATVSQNGKVTAKAAGTATIRATANDGSGKYATCAVTVTASTTPVSGVSLNNSSLTIKQGRSAMLSASVSPSNASNKSVTWSTSASSVATVSSSGVVTGVAPGTAVITVRTADGGYTATCQVTVEADDTPTAGNIAVEDLAVAAVQTSASAGIQAENVDSGSLSATSNSSWITGLSVDTSGSTPWVRLSFGANNKTTSRSAVITVTGTGTDGNTCETTFTVTQRGASSSDVPCTSMTVNGGDTIDNSGNSAEYSVTCAPSGTTQRAVTWSVQGPATITPNGLNCVVNLTGSGTVILTATNYYNSNIVASKRITATYNFNPGNVSATPSAVTIPSTAGTDNTPVITTSDILQGSLTVSSTSGCISAAEIQDGRLVVTFGENSSTTQPRSGKVTLQAEDLNGDLVYCEVQYTQTAMPTPSFSFAITGLNVTQIGGKYQLKMRVAYHNSGMATSTVYAPAYQVKGYDDSGNQVITLSGQFPDKVISANSTEVEIYAITKSGTIGSVVNYTASLESGLNSSTYTGDGNDEIDD